MSWITEFLDAGGAGDLLQGGASLYGYKQLTDDLGKTQDRIGGYNADTGQYTGGLGKVYGDVNDAGAFRGYSMRSGLGSGGMDANGNMYNNLNPQQQAYSDQMRQGAQGFYGQAGQNTFANQAQGNFGRGQNNAFAGQAQNYFDRAAQDPAARERDIY